MRVRGEQADWLWCACLSHTNPKKIDARISTYDSLDIGHYRALPSICSDIQGQTDAVEAHGGKQAHVCP